MSHKRILSLQSSKEELWEGAQRQGYVYVRTESGFVTRDDLSPHNPVRTSWYGVWLSQGDYGKTWALEEKELK